MSIRPISGKDLETIRAANCSDDFEVTGDYPMADLAALISGQMQSVFLGERDMIVLREQADDIDAAYGALLDTLVPDALARLAEQSCAA